MIYFVGDVHGNFDLVLEDILSSPDTGPRFAVFLGDLQPQRPLLDLISEYDASGVEMWWIPGNHDSDTKESWEFLQTGGDRNLHGRVAVLGGTRVGGLGGVFRGTVWDPAIDPVYGCFEDFLKGLAAERTKGLFARRNAGRRPPTDKELMLASLVDRLDGKALKHRSSIFQADYLALSRECADVLVTHEAPSYHRHGFGKIDDLAAAMGVSRLWHGHHHVSVMGSAEAFVPFCVGYRGIVREDGLILRPGNYDKNLFRGDLLTRGHDGAAGPSKRSTP